MSGLICGRCGQRTAPDSSYCPRCRWALVGANASLFAVTHLADKGLGGVVLDLVGDAVRSVERSVVIPEAPSGAGGVMARRRVEKQRAHLERDIQAIVEPRVEALEEKLIDKPGDAAILSELGTLNLLQENYERSIAYLQRAHELNPADLDTTINLGIALAHRGNVQPAFTLYSALRDQNPNEPRVLFNLALIALQARRADEAINATNQLEKLWQQTPSLLSAYHNDTLTTRGLAFLVQGKADEARQTLQTAARSGHFPSAAASNGTSSTRSDNSGLLSEEETLAADFHIESDGVEFKDVAADSGQSADYLNNLAIAEAGVGAYDKAQSHLSEAVRIEPGNARVDSNLGILAYQRGEVDFAYKMLDLARQIEQASHTEATTHNHLGVVLSTMGRADDAWREFGLASGHERADFEVWYNLGRAYIESGKPDRAMSFLRRAFAVDPNNPDLHCTLGTGYLLRGNKDAKLLDEALKHYKRALQIDARHFPSLIGMAMTCAQMNNAPGALVVLAQTQKLFPQRIEVLFLRAFYSLTLDTDNDRVPRAGTQFNAVYAAQPDLLAADYNAAVCQYLLGMQESAMRVLEKVVQRDPSFVPAYYLIGVGHAVAKHYDQALAAWKTAATLDPENADIHAGIGFASYQNGLWADAYTAFERASRLLPQDAEIAACLGLAYGRAGGELRKEREARADKKVLIKTAGAVERDAQDLRLQNNLLTNSTEAFERSLRLKPGNAVTHSNLGLSYYFQNKVESAVEQWRIVSRLDARYAMQREEDQYTNYDDSQMALRPLRWRDMIIGMMPILPPPHTRLVPGYNERAFRPALADAQLQRLHTLRRQLAHTTRLQSWMNAKH